MRLSINARAAAIGLAFVVFPALAHARPGTQAASATQSAAAPSIDSAAAAAHLAKARQSLAELTRLRAAAQLSGEPRTWTENLITNFNQLLTTKTDWTREFAEVRYALDRLLAMDSGTAPADQPVGTSGTTAASLDPAVKSKLQELHTQLEAFYTAAGSPALPPPAGEPTAPRPPSEPAAPVSAEPAAPAPPAEPAAPPAAETPAPLSPTKPATSRIEVHLVPENATSTSTTTVISRSSTESGTSQLEQHLDQIAAIVNEALGAEAGAATVTIDRSKLEAIRSHLEGAKSLMTDGRD
jgi:hypothetical protein